MSYPVYPEVKASGVEWLGDVPTHWHISRLKNSVSSSRNGVWGDEPQGDENDLVCVRVADFNRQNNTVKPDKFTFRNIARSEQKGRVLKRGDLLLEKSGGGELQPVGFVVTFNHDCPAVCSNFVARLQPSKRADSRYFCYVHSAAYAARLNSRSIKQTTGIQNLDEDAYLDEVSPFPPLPEQQQIAAFLDRKTAELDAVLAQKERQLQLLAEKRQALISQAVTRGLDPTAPLRPSGIPWLGDVPEHWEIGPLKHLAKIKYGLGQPPSAMDDGLPLLRATNVERGKINSTGLMFIDPSDVPYDRDPVLRTNDIIVVRSGAYTGDSAIVPAQYDGAIAGYDMVVRAKTADPFFLAYGLLSTPILNNQIDLLRMRAAQPHLNAEELGECLFFVPPVPEQRAIVAYLDRETARMDGIAQAVRTQTEKVREYRQALISAAVTGKIDVREREGVPV